MFERYVLIINDIIYDNSEDLINVKLINKLNEECVIVKILGEYEKRVEVLFKGKINKHIIDEKYFNNVKIKEILNYELDKLLLEKDIKILLHFTNIKNLSSILENGLVTRDELKKLDKYYINDQSRYDCTDAICLSISFANYKMFYRLLCENEDEEWVIMKIDPKIFNILDCGYFYTNAANHVFGDRNDKKYKTIASLANLFCEEYPPNILNKHIVDRKKLGIKNCWTTDPQAEVLVFENIPTEYIKGVLYFKDSCMTKFKNNYPNFDHQVKREAFSYRSDYNFWKGE